MRFAAITLTIMLLAVGAAVPATQAEEAAPSSMTINMIDSKGNSIGTATLTSQEDAVHLHLVAEGLKPGAHGIHFHEAGKCEPPSFTTAGGHFNPAHKEHGFKNPQGPHAGDLKNIEVGKDGKVNTVLKSTMVTLKPGQPHSLLQKDGLSLIIHEKADDYKTDPAGNSGNRIACGVIK